jgi:hypothetical protein
MNFYGSDLCVVHDEEYGKDHAIFVRHKDGRIETIYQRDQTDKRWSNSGSFKLKESKTSIKRKERKAKKKGV